MNRIIYNIILGVISLLFFSCSSNNDYNSLVNRGLQSGIQNDSLFLGYHFGMSSEDFHSSSWELNQQGVLTGYTAVEYTFTELKSPAKMEFYPIFQNGRITRMPISVEYHAWAPWNQQYWPEQLIMDLIEYYEDEYETSFRSVFVPEIEKFAQVSIEGNREIRIYQNSESSVMVEFVDLNSITASES